MVRLRDVLELQPRGPAFDERTGQWPANNLALGQTVAAYLAAYRATGEPRWLSGGQRLLDYLLLYQQCWTNPVLENLSGPAMLLGGFTTQNSDAEWSDARQSQCTPAARAKNRRIEFNIVTH